MTSKSIIRTEGSCRREAVLRLKVWCTWAWLTRVREAGRDASPRLHCSGNSPSNAEGRSGNPRLLSLPPFSSGDVRHPTTRPLAERAAQLVALLPVPPPAPLPTTFYPRRCFSSRVTHPWPRRPLLPLSRLPFACLLGCWRYVRCPDPADALLEPRPGTRLGSVNFENKQINVPRPWKKSQL